MLYRDLLKILSKWINHGNKVNIIFKKGVKGNNNYRGYGPGIPEDQYKNVFKPFLDLIKAKFK